MKATMVVPGLICTVLIAGSGFLFYRMGMQQGMEMNNTTEAGSNTTGSPGLDTREDPSQWSNAEGEEATRRHIAAGISAGDMDPVTGLQVTHYYDPMRPTSKFTAPGKSPFMNMMLVPAYEGANGQTDVGTVAISPRMQQNTGIRTALVTEGVLAPVISATGVITWNERDQAIIQARAEGFVEKLYVRATLDPVTAGEPLADLYVPAWIALQEEYVALTRMQGNDLSPLLEAAKARMRQAGMIEEQIELVTSSRQAPQVFTLKSPVSGLISELAIREGMTVMPGMTLFRINGTATIWAEAEVPESPAALLQVGDTVTATTPSIPDTHFEGQIQAMLPALDPQLRTRKARLELENTGAQLVPGMLMQMELSAASQQTTLLVPTEAIIDTGDRTVVMLAEGSGGFRPVTVTTGLESDGQTAIVSGLQAGQSVVVSGQFLVDSEASLSGLEARMEEMSDATVNVQETQTHRTPARIDAITDTSVMLSHPPITTLNWPAMTMNFALPAEGLPSEMSIGASVNVGFVVNANGQPQIIDIVPAQDEMPMLGNTP